MENYYRLTSVPLLHEHTLFPTVCFDLQTFPSSIGRWIKIDSHQVPKAYFEYLLGRINVHVNSVREVCHKAQPGYKGTTLKLSYKIWDLGKLLDALEGQSLVTLNTDVLFSGNEECERQDELTAEEEIKRAKRQVYVPGYKRKRPSSKSLLIVGYGEGRATREAELIWWPHLYTATAHGQMVLRMYIEKCEF